MRLLLLRPRTIWHATCYALSGWSRHKVSTYGSKGWVRMSVWPSGRGRKGAANDQSSSNCTVDRLSNRGDTSVSPWSAQKPGSSLYARHTQLQSHDCSARPPGPRRPTPATRRATGDLTQGQCGAVRGGESGPALAPRRQGPGRTPPAGPWWAIPSDPKSKGINCPTF